MSVNRQWLLARHPETNEVIGFDHFTLNEREIPKPDDGEILVQTIALGTSPAQRSYVSKSLSMHDKIAIGDVMRGRGTGIVTESRNPNYSVGEIVIASTGWQDFSIQSPARQNPNVLSIQKVENPIYPLTMTLGVLGGAGATAYFGLMDVGLLRAGDTVVISAAAGGVGSVAGQIARIAGCRVIGIAGGPEKFICGFISTDYKDDLKTGPKNYENLVRKRARMEGFFIFDYRHRFDESEARLRQWYQSGLLINCEDVDDGLEHMPATLGSLFTGGNKGIKLCRVSPDPD